MKYKKIGIVIQARMGSTRLPSKIIKKLYENENILSLLIKRMKLSKLVDIIIIATTPSEINQPIIILAKELGVSSFIGSENNVLKRYYEAAKEYKLDLIIRITSDCPFVDPFILDEMIKFYENHDYDYIKNIDETTSFPRGFDIEIFTFKVLEKIFSIAKTKPEKEHVTSGIYSHPEIFSIYNYNVPSLKKFENLRLTIDEKEDLVLCKKIYKILVSKGKSIDFSIFDIFDIIRNQPELININKHVQQKKA